jgi:uncharacterized membrane protein
LATLVALRLAQSENQSMQSIGPRLHPAIVTLPVGCWLAAAMFDVVTWLEGSEAAFTASSCLLAFGTLVALVAVPTGLASMADLQPGRPARRLAMYHAAANLTAMFLATVNIVLRTSARDLREATLALSLATAALIAVSSAVGVKMIHRQLENEARRRWRQARGLEEGTICTIRAGRGRI